MKCCASLSGALAESTKWDYASQIIDTAQAKLAVFTKSDPVRAHQNLSAWAKSQIVDLEKKQSPIVMDVVNAKGLPSDLDIADLEKLQACINVLKAIEDSPLEWDDELSRIEHQMQHESIDNRIEDQKTAEKVAEVKSAIRGILAIEITLVFVVLPLLYAFGLF